MNTYEADVSVDFKGVVALGNALICVRSDPHSRVASARGPFEFGQSPRGKMGWACRALGIKNKSCFKKLKRQPGAGATRRKPNIP
jgi:hypothetical protein